jgi:hypothetical protein
MMEGKRNPLPLGFEDCFPCHPGEQEPLMSMSWVTTFDERLIPPRQEPISKALDIDFAANLLEIDPHLTTSRDCDERSAVGMGQIEPNSGAIS